MGGHCVAIDPWFLHYQNPAETTLIKAARAANNRKTQWVEDKIKDVIDAFYRENNRKPTIAFFGLSYKPDIDDLRESPACHIVSNIAVLNPDLLIVEPNLSYSEEYDLVSIEEAIEQADIIVFLVKHKEFYNKVKSSMLRNKIVIDYIGVL